MGTSQRQDFATESHSNLGKHTHTLAHGSPSMLRIRRVVIVIILAIQPDLLGH